MMWRWGIENGDLSFIQALEREKHAKIEDERNDLRHDSTVNDAEVRAVSMLLEVCDSERAAFYLHTGVMPCVGNKTGTVYMVKRSHGVDEIRNGRVDAIWCISIPGAGIYPVGEPHEGRCPITDMVMVLKAMIEGNEEEFRKIGNRHNIGSVHEPYGLYDVFPNPYMNPLQDMPLPLNPWTHLYTPRVFEAQPIFPDEHHIQYMMNEIHGDQYHNEQWYKDFIENSWSEPNQPRKEPDRDNNVLNAIYGPAAMNLFAGRDVQLRGHGGGNYPVAQGRLRLGEMVDYLSADQVMDQNSAQRLEGIFEFCNRDVQSQWCWTEAWMMITERLGGREARRRLDDMYVSAFHAIEYGAEARQENQIALPAIRQRARTAGETREGLALDATYAKYGPGPGSETPTQIADIIQVSI